MIRLGVTSRSAAIWSRVVHSARTAPRARRPRTLCRPDVRRHWSTRVCWVKPLSHSNSSAAHPSLPVSASSAAEHLAQLDEHLDVEGGVLEPRFGERARRPVDGGVLLGHPLAQQRLDQRGQPDPRVAEQPPGELGVEQSRGVQPELGQAGQVLGRGVQDPLGALEGLLQRGQRVEGDRVDQEGAGAFAAQLDQVGAGRVAVAGGPLGVDGDRAGAAGDGRADLGEAGRGVDDLRAGRRAARAAVRRERPGLVCRVGKVFGGGHRSEG